MTQPPPPANHEPPTKNNERSHAAALLANVPRRRLTPAEAPTCPRCNARYKARNTYPAVTRYQRSCTCPGIPFARYVHRPPDLDRLDPVTRIRLAHA